MFFLVLIVDFRLAGLSLVGTQRCACNGGSRSLSGVAR